ncbi:MAG: hypothetical protein M1600_08745 [Firmicutes bacterium]|nr:hypothetical protein [Bacillota bacterium]
MIRWHKSVTLLALSLTLSLAPPLLARAQAVVGPPHSTRLPTHHPHVGTIQSVSPRQITIAYPTGSPIPKMEVALAGAYLRAGFYPVTQLPFASGQHVFVMGTRSSHPTIMLLPEARGTLNQTGSSWTLQSAHATVALALDQPILLGGAQLTSGAKVDVFGTRLGSQIRVSIIAGSPHVLKAVVTTIQKNQLHLRSDTGGTLTYPIANLPDGWMRHLSQLPPDTPVLAVVSPEGTVLGVLPMHALRHSEGFSHHL